MGNLTGKSSKIIRLTEESESSKKAKLNQEKRQWLECATFSDLSPEGRDALIQYSKGKNLNTDIRRFEFWFSSPDDHTLVPLLTKYLSDGEDQLPEVQESDNTDDIIEHAQEVDSYISRLKDRMRPRLNDVFKRFKHHLAEEIRREQHLSSSSSSSS